MRKRQIIFLVFGFLFLANILAWIAVFDLAEQKFLEVTFFDVGQGDAIFIVSPQRHQILIDGGPSSVILEKLGKEMPFWDKSIDLVILTHPERDHLAGLIEVLKKYKIENIFLTGVVRDTTEYKEWLKLIKEGYNLPKDGAFRFAKAPRVPTILPALGWAPKPKIFIAKSERRIKTKNFVFETLFPFENLAGKEFKDSNDTSIVNRLVYNKNSFIFTGDITKSIEKELIIRENSCSDSRELASINSNVLKVGHHGSKTSSSEDFLKAVSPEIAVISVGKNNSYGHPHSETLANLENYGINILRTDLVGDIKIISDGKNLKLKTEN